mgnify:CR=1 FL=1
MLVKITDMSSSFLEKLKKGMGNTGISLPEKELAQNPSDIEAGKEKEDLEKEYPKEEPAQIPAEIEAGREKKISNPKKIKKEKKPKKMDKKIVKQEPKEEIREKVEEEQIEEEISAPKEEEKISFTKTRFEMPKPIRVNKEKSWLESEGQLTVDVYETDKNIVIRSAVAGVKPDDLDISVENDMLIIKGKREKIEEETARNYFYQECYWGKFSREIVLPEEVDFSKIEAVMKEGVLIIKIPKTSQGDKKIKINRE